MLLLPMNMPGLLRIMSIISNISINTSIHMAGAPCEFKTIGIYVSAIFRPGIFRSERQYSTGSFHHPHPDIQQGVRGSFQECHPPLKTLCCKIQRNIVLGVIRDSPSCNFLIVDVHNYSSTIDLRVSCFCL